ncbi:hypothetical protein AVEN_253423-1 [Araneus ventricosus]|uniref:Uncharacterized protein n=1 Tax=Araneus ventricosus TaxID=182803 RepID=A0A4Y2WGQ2_ARAVE|nr:hypothetical protein AVEN_99386-1 [Araneus ventricosus]GBO36789.1 hypothetical protein AVEN_253423-1 [Araneus ventricosus]
MCEANSFLRQIETLTPSTQTLLPLRSLPLGRRSVMKCAKRVFILRLPTDILHPDSSLQRQGKRPMFTWQGRCLSADGDTSTYAVPDHLTYGEENAG